MNGGDFCVSAKGTDHQSRRYLGVHRRVDDGADAVAPASAQQQREPDLSVLWPYGSIRTSVTCGACDSNSVMMLRMSATPAITLGMTHWSHSRRRRSISSVVTGVGQNLASGGTEKFPSWNWVGRSPGRVHSRYPGIQQKEVMLMTLALALALVSIFLCGVGLGMSIWSLAFALKRLVWKDGKDSGNSGDNSRSKGQQSND